MVKAPINQLSPNNPCLASISMVLPCLSSSTTMNLGSLMISSGLFHSTPFNTDPHSGMFVESSQNWALEQGNQESTHFCPGWLSIHDRISSSFFRYRLMLSLALTYCPLTSSQFIYWEGSLTCSSESEEAMSPSPSMRSTSSSSPSKNSPSCSVGSLSLSLSWYSWPSWVGCSGSISNQVSNLQSLFSFIPNQLWQAILNDNLYYTIKSGTMGSPLYEDSPEFFSKGIEIALACLALVSSVISLLLPALYYVERKCRQHPAELIAIISLLEALSNYNVILIGLNIYQFENWVQISAIFDYLVFNRIREPTQTNFCEINFTIYILLELLSIGYNIAFSADLLITLKRPFFAGAKRMKFYHLFTLAFIAAALPMSIVEAEEICSAQFHQRSIYKIPKAFLGSIGLFYAISSVIIVMSFTSVQSNQIRRKYVQLHRIILFTLMVLWLFPLLTNILILRGDQASGLFRACNVASFVSLLLSGAVINVVRFYCDPYTWTQIKKMVRECRPVRRRKRSHHQQEQQGTQQESIDIWNLPLANAVSTYHHQSVVSNIIEIVLETCVNGSEDTLSEHSSTAEEPSDYMFASAVIKVRDIKKHLRNGSKQDIRRLTKIKKSLEMLCLETKESDRKNSQKNIYKANDLLQQVHSGQGLNFSSNQSPSFRDKKKLNQENAQNVVRDLEGKAITIKVQSYADPVFVSLRLMDRLNSQQLSSTLNLLSNAQSIKKARESLGASGSFFFFSFDNRLVIKTITQKQCEIFLKILPEYYEHIANNPHSLISRTYGLFSVEIAGISKIYFIMMENTLKSFEQNNIIYKRYDLKGSTIKRQVKDPNAQVFKDINYLKSDDAFLMMSSSRKKQLIEQIQRDTSLLKSQNIMDYSLLLGVGIHKPMNKQPGPGESEEDSSGSWNQWRWFEDGSDITGRVYSLSLIDYLQEYDWNKLLELKLKKVFKGGGDISSVDSKTYYERFASFVSRIIVVVNS